jgi:uncharacterized protein YggU (UPF0235/DUF167 family)
VKINVKVIPKAHCNSVEVVDDVYVVRTVVVSEDGKANAMVQKLLAKHFGVPKSAVRIVRGTTSRMKVVEVDQ